MLDPGLSGLDEALGFDHSGAIRIALTGKTTGMIGQRENLSMPEG